MFDGPYIDAIEAASFSYNPQHVDIYSVSWGPDDTGSVLDGPKELGEKAIKEGRICVFFHCVFHFILILNIEISYNFVKLALIQLFLTNFCISKAFFKKLNY